jgi:hypothetical protein
VPETHHSEGATAPYETLVREAAEAVALPAISETVLRSDTLVRVPARGGGSSRPAKSEVLLGIANCSEDLARLAATRGGILLDTIVTTERTGFYKPQPRR